MRMMLPNKIVSFILIFTILFSTLFFINVKSIDNLEENIEATFNIEIKSGTEFHIDIIANVEKIILDASGTYYNKNDINHISENNSELMGAIKYDLKNSFTNQINEIFNKTEIHSLNELPSYKNGLFYDSYKINLTPAYFSFKNDVFVSDFINGILDMGGIINYSFNLMAENGWNNTFNFILSDMIGYHRTTGIVNHNTLQWNIENYILSNPNKIAEFSLKYHNPTSSYDNEDINIAFELNCNYRVNNSLKMLIIPDSINIEKYSLVPDFITNLNYIPSDGVRLFIDNYFLTWDDFYNKTIEGHYDEVKLNIQNSSFNQSLDFSFQWDSNSTLNCSNPYDIYSMDNNPPINAIFIDDKINLLIDGISSNAFFGLINSGATSNLSTSDLNFGNDFDFLKYNYSIALNLPDNINLNDNNIIKWYDNNKVNGNVTSNISPDYLDEKIDTIIDIDFQTTDLNILSLFTGDTKFTFGLFIQEIQNRNITQLPLYFELPKNINLKYFNSDCFRLCVDEEIFDNESIDKFLSDELYLFENRIKNIFTINDVKANLDDQKLKDSLKWDKDISNMSDENPIIISSYSNIAYTVPFSFNIFPPSIKIKNQNFTIPYIKNHNLKYRLIFPKGIKIEIINQTSNINLNKSDAGEYIVEIAFNKSKLDYSKLISLKISPSFIFIISLFIPCIISLVIALILLIIIFILRKKRVIKRGAIIKESNENNNNYVNENYYVPPPPKK